MRDDLIREFAELYPKLYHMAESGSWENIQRHGLLSTSALLDLFEISGSQREALESQWRSTGKKISHPVHGEAVVRDQRPMPPNALRSALIDMNPEQWYKFLNRRVFFWVSEDRLKGMLRTYRNDSHDVLTLDTTALLEAYADRATVSQINTGYALRRPAKRSMATLQSLPERRLTSGFGRLAELTVDYALPDVSRFVLSVDSRRGGDLGNPIWRP